LARKESLAEHLSEARTESVSVLNREETLQ